ncbi:MAG TPA: hypothetical protein VGN72_05575 [Tepidisphaeraceae bacterium]|jgi:hypothetical protein|nr:hypothetical protein [Tepidisphaeraceae bacterium]
MLKTVEAIIDEHGNVTLAEPIELTRRSRALLTILDESAAVDDVTRMSESGLRDWLRPEEDEAWAHLQPAR